MKKVLIGVGVVAVLAGGGFLLYQNRAAKTNSGPETSSSSATPVKAAGAVKADAKVVPAKSAMLAFAGGGIVREVLVTEGQPVKAGEVLARLNAEQQSAAVAQLEARVRQAEARVRELKAGPRPQEVAAAQASLDRARAEAARMKQGPLPEEVLGAEAEVTQAEEQVKQATQAANEQEIAAANAALRSAQARLARLTRGATADELATAQAEVRRAEAQLDLVRAGARPEAIAAAEAEVAAAWHSLEEAQAALANTELKAPFDGVVASLSLKVGEMISPGSTALALADFSAWQLETEDLTELNIARVKEGAAVAFTVDALPGVEMQGKVGRIKGMGEKKQGDITYTVVIQPEQQDERLRWNMTASVSIQAD